MTERVENDIYLLLGSNLGDREAYLKNGIDLLESRDFEIMDRSSVYSTRAWGKTDQPTFLNQVIHVRSSHDPVTVLSQLLQVENLLGRKRNGKWGPRNIDIDLLFYGKSVIDLPELKVPHPELHLRRFTLEPLNQLIPDFSHPVLGKTISELLSECPDHGEVRLHQGNGRSNP